MTLTPTRTPSGLLTAPAEIREAAFTRDSRVSVASDGTVAYIHMGLLHREDGPAIRRPDGTREWWSWGRRHRDGGPAIELPDGSVQYHKFGMLHRFNEPAIIMADGSTEWWMWGKRHNTKGHAVYTAGVGREWWERGQRHRIEGPAVVRYTGELEWWVRGSLHCMSGGFVEQILRNDGETSDWYRDGQPVTVSRVVASSKFHAWHFTGARVDNLRPGESQCRKCGLFRGQDKRVYTALTRN